MTKKKEILVKSKSQYRRIEAQGGNPVLVRPCRECGTNMKYEHIPDLGNTWRHWRCPKCGSMK